MLFRLKRFLFHKQSFLLIPVILFLWYSIDAIYSYNVTIDDLVPYTGLVVFMDNAVIPISAKTGKGAKGYYLRLKLNSEVFRTFELRTSPKSRHYFHIASQVKLGNAVTLYTEPQFLDGLMRRRGSNTVVKLIKGKTIIYDYSNLSRRVSLRMMLIFIPLLIGSLMLYFVKTRRRLLNN